MILANLIVVKCEVEKCKLFEVDGCCYANLKLLLYLDAVCLFILFDLYVRLCKNSAKL